VIPAWPHGRPHRTVMFQLRKMNGFLIVFLICLSCVFTGCGTEYRLDVASAVQQLKDIRTAQATYMQRNGHYGSLEDLANVGLIPPELADGENENFRFQLWVDGSTYRVTGMTIKEVPENAPGISFYMDETGVIRAIDKARVPADARSEPIVNQ